MASDGVKTVELNSHSEYQDVIRATVKIFVDRGNQIFKHPKLPLVISEIKFDIRGGAAGTANRRNVLRFHPVLMKENLADYIENTVPHEVAHLFTFILYPQASGHGPEWKSVMRALGAEPSRCHSYDMRNVGVREPVECKCGTRYITKRKANSIRRAGAATCGKCKQQVKLAGLAPIPLMPPTLITSRQALTQKQESKRHVCAICQKALSPNVVNYCQKNARRFNNQLYCFEHQMATVIAS